MSGSGSFPRMSTQGRGPGRLWAATITAVLVATVCACTPDPAPIELDPSGSPSTTPTSTPSPTPTPTPTVPGEVLALPDGAKPERPALLDGEPSVEAAVAFATYFVGLFPYSLQTNDSTDFASASHPDCVFCTSVKNDVAGQTERSEHTVGGGISISAATATEIDLGRHFAAYLTIHEAPSHVENEFGTVTDRDDEPNSYAVEMAIFYDGSTWSMREVSSDEATP